MANTQGELSPNFVRLQLSISRKEGQVTNTQPHPQIFEDKVILVLVEDQAVGAVKLQTFDFKNIHKTIDALCRNDLQFQQASEDYWNDINEANANDLAFQKVCDVVTKLNLNWIQEEFLSRSYCLIQKPRSYNSVRFLKDCMIHPDASQL